jgi:hypothetical protein
MTMRTRLKMFAMAAAMAAGASTAAMAQYPCVPGYSLYGGVCQPTRPLGYSNPVSGAVQGEAAGAAQGYRAAGPVGAVVGGALGTATGTIAGTTNRVTGAPTVAYGSSMPPAAPGCAPGYVLYSGGCYPAR